MTPPDYYLVVCKDNMVHYGCDCASEYAPGPAFAYDLCQQYINDAIDMDIDGAVHWRVVPVMRTLQDHRRRKHD